MRELTLQARVLPAQAGLCHRAPHHVAYFDGIERTLVDQVIPYTTAQGLNCGLFRAKGRREDHRRFGLLFLEDFEHLDTHHSRQDEVKENKVWFALARELKASVAIHRGDDFIAD